MSFSQNIRILIIRSRAAISRKIQTGALKHNFLSQSAFVVIIILYLFNRKPQTKIITLKQRLDNITKKIFKKTVYMFLNCSVNAAFVHKPTANEIYI